MRLIIKADVINPSEITPKSVYMDRRKFMQKSIAASLLLTADAMLPAWAKKYPDLKQSPYSTGDKPNSFEDITTYNNFYEFGTSKKDPHKNATEFNPHPWSISVAGECAKQGTYDLEDFIKPADLEERIYRLRCVEGWSMVIPWEGFPLHKLLKEVEPKAEAKYVRFETIYDSEGMPGIKTNPFYQAYPAWRRFQC